MDIRSDLLSWAVGLLITVPLLIIVLSEVIVRFEQRNSVYTRFWQRLRDIVLPLVAAFLIVRQMLAVETAAPGMRLLETAVWAVVAYTLGSLISAIGRASSDKSRWEAAIPSLFQGLLRLVVMGVPLYYILSEIWGLKLNDLFAALGVGSLVIALALQDTLSSIVSGFLLTLDRPFEAGDHILIDGSVGTVIDLNWRSVRVRINGRDVVIVPNSQLASQSIYNLSTFDPSYRDELLIDFDYDDSPNECKQILTEAVLSSPYVTSDPVPFVFLHSFESSAIRYQVVFYVAEFKGSIQQREVRSDVRTRIYYATRRAGLTMSPATTLIHQPAQIDIDTSAALILDRIQNHPLFTNLPKSTLNLLAQRARLQTYGTRELILPVDKPSNGLYIVLSGRAAIIPSHAGDDAMIPLVEGSIFGEMVFLGSRPNTAAVRGLSDVIVIYIPSGDINDALRQNPRFALALDRLVSEREALLESYNAENIP